MSDLHTMQLNDGRVFTPLSDYDVLNEVYEYMGQDVHDYIAGILLETDVEREIEEKKFNSDFRCLEQSNENWHTMVQDWAEEIEQLREKVEEGKLTKPKISLELFRIYKDMRGEL